MQHAIARPVSTIGVVLAGAALVVAPATPVPGLDEAVSRQVALTSESGPDVADLDSFLNDVGLGTLVSDNVFELQAADPTEGIGDWSSGVTFTELANLLGGVDASTLTMAAIEAVGPVADDIKDMLGNPSDFSADLSQFFPLAGQGVDEIMQTAVGLLLLT